MRKAARVIIIKDDQLLVMHRNKFGAEYDTLPGGAVDMGETPEQAAWREVAEETGVQIENVRLVFLEHAGEMYGDQYVFLCDYVSGEPVLSENSHEHAINQMGKNIYEPRWLKLSELPDAPFVSGELKQNLLDCLANGWPDQVIEFASQRRI